MASLAWNRWILYRSWNSEEASQFYWLRRECKIAVQNWWHFQSRDLIVLIVSHVPRGRLCSNENGFSVVFGGRLSVAQAGYSYPWKHDISNPYPWQSEEFNLGLYELLVLCGSWWWSSDINVLATSRATPWTELSHTRTLTKICQLHWQYYTKIVPH